MQKYLFATVFISGMTSLAVEMAASRLLGNVFGTSNLVWASIIGLILIYLAVGYFLGGYWVDRDPSFRTFYRIQLWAALALAIVPLVARPVLRIAADAFDQLQLGVLFGSFSAVLILLIIPITLLGTVSPFAIRLAVQDANLIGSTSGKIYAISTLGSFLGTFLPVLVLIPTIGTYRTFLFFSGALLVVALVGLWLAAGWRGVLPYLWMPLLVGLLVRPVNGLHHLFHGILGDDAHLGCPGAGGLEKLGQELLRGRQELDHHPLVILAGLEEAEPRGRVGEVGVIPRRGEADHGGPLLILLNRQVALGGQGVSRPVLGQGVDVEDPAFENPSLGEEEGKGFFVGLPGALHEESGTPA